MATTFILNDSTFHEEQREIYGKLIVKLTEILCYLNFHSNYKSLTKRGKYKTLKTAIYFLEASLAWARAVRAASPSACK